MAVIVSLLIGFFTMLPDDYENLSQSSVATLLFANNFLSSITIKNYWDVLNDLKPLMHTWYLGILVQFYVVFYFIIFVSKLIKKPDVRKKGIFYIMLFGVCTSFLLYVLPISDLNMKFYMLPFRFFELGVGCLVTYIKTKKFKLQKLLSVILFFALIILLVLPFNFIPNQIRLVSVVILTASLVWIFKSGDHIIGIFNLKPIMFIGKMSYSIFIWHQVIVAFYRYIISAEFKICDIVIIILLTAVISTLSYYFAELKLAKKIKIKQVKSTVAVIFVSVICLGVSGVIYLRAGVVKDYPELDIYANNVTRGMHAKYCDRIYSYDKDFTNTDKINVLLIGDSFARDMGNIILESDIADKVEISYSYSYKTGMEKRYEQADYIFTRGNKTNLESDENIMVHIKNKENIYSIGVKRYGDNNGVIYNRRFFDYYLSQRVKMDSEIKKENDLKRKEWGEDKVIDLMELVADENDTIPVFTDDGKYISQDTRHLTKAGAQYYARILDLDKILSIND